MKHTVVHSSVKQSWFFEIPFEHVAQRKNIEKVYQSIKCKQFVEIWRNLLQDVSTRSPKFRKFNHFWQHRII